MSAGPELAAAADVLLRDYMALRPGESVLITADTASDMTAAQAIMNAALVAGAKPSLMVIPQLPFQGALADPYVPPALAAAASSSAVWIDLTFPYLAGAHIQDEAMKTGRIRYLLGGDMGAGGLVRLFGKVDLDRYYAVHSGFDDIVNAAIGKTVRITDELGTDVSFTLAKPGFKKPRRADGPGMVLVPGSCTMFPELESVKGEIHVRAAFHEYYTPLNPPLTLRVEGRIRELGGGGNERRVMERALRRAAGGQFGHVIHFTHGIHPAARVTGASFIEDMRATGNDAVGFGVPWWLPGGGENHPDAIVSMQSIWIDGRQVVERGQIVAPDPLAKLADALAPLAA
jgi:leucyl aminopeptidase (aminopeptidase T)